MHHSSSFSLCVSVCVLILVGTVVSSQAYEKPRHSLLGACMLGGENEGVLSASSEARIPGLSKPLAALAAASHEGRGGGLERSRRFVRVRGDMVQILALTQPALHDHAVAAIERYGGVVDLHTQFSGKARLQCWVPVSALEALAGGPFIENIRTPSYGYVPEHLKPTPHDGVSPAGRAGAVTTEGLTKMDAESWITDTNGAAGVKVGVIDLGFTGYGSMVAAGELPSCTTNDFTSDGEGLEGVTEHGVACAEIVHDIAPNASLYLARISSVDELSAAKDWMKAQGVDIISMSMGWYIVDSGDGSGVIPAIMEDARNNGILWIVAAGNQRMLHWGGTFNWLKMEWGGIDITAHEYIGGVDVLNELWDPATNQAAQIPAGTDIVVQVRWNDWANANLDYDVFLAKWDTSLATPNWRIIAEDTTTQNGDVDDEPTALIEHTTSGATTRYAILFAKFGHGDIRWVDFDLFVTSHWGSLEHYVPSRSLDNTAVSVDCLAAGAVDVATPYQHLENSSEGPTNGAGGAATGGYIKPDIAGYSNVSTATYGHRNFSGTSPAAPHVAGALALFRAAFPHHTPDQLRATLTERARRCGDSNAVGYGRVFMGLTPANAGAIWILLRLEAE